MSKSIDKFLDSKIARLERIESIYGGFEKESDQYTYELLKELREYRQLKAAGLLLQLPCKIGDKAYIPAFGKVYEYNVSGFNVDVNGAWLIFLEYEYEDRTFTRNADTADIGKTIFFSQAAAEQELQALKEGTV